MHSKVCARGGATGPADGEAGRHKHNRLQCNVALDRNCDRSSFDLCSLRWKQQHSGGVVKRCRLLRRSGIAAFEALTVGVTHCHGEQ
jgi:hypothetical protein